MNIIFIKQNFGVSGVFGGNYINFRKDTNRAKSHIFEVANRCGHYKK